MRAAAALVALLALAAGTARGHVTRPNGEYEAAVTESGQLSKAVDAAISELMGEKGWFHALKEKSGYTHALEVATCTPDRNKWVYPPKAEATGSLKRVLETGELVVAGVEWSAPGAADYKTDPAKPTGFWPDYLDAIANKMSAAYGQAIAVKRVYYGTSGVVVDKVGSGHVDMSEPYYYISGFTNNKPRIEVLDFSCVTAATESAFNVKKDSGITTFDQLYDALRKGPLHTVGFIGQGNYDAMSAKLPESAVPYIPPNPDSAALNQRVRDGQDLAVYVSEYAPDESGEFTAIASGVVSPRVVLFPKAEVSNPSATAASPTTSGSGDSENTAVIIGLVVVAVLALLLGATLSFVVVRERRGSPIFMPLIADNKMYSGSGPL